MFVHELMKHEIEAVFEISWLEMKTLIIYFIEITQKNIFNHYSWLDGQI